MKVLELRGHTLEAITLGERAIPEPKANEVLVKINATSLNFRDYAVAMGRYQTNLPLPFVPLSDGAGTVVAIGSDVTQFKLGDRVTSHYTTAWQSGRFKEHYHQSKLGGALDGLAQEYRSLPEQAWVSTPNRLTDEQAATLPVAALTAWNSLQDLQLTSGSWLLIQGTGSVSLFALQFARAQGIRVIATTTNAHKVSTLRALGAEKVLPIKNLKEWGLEAYQLADNEGVDGVIDVGGNVTLTHSLSAIRGGGSVAMVGFLGGFDAAPDLTLPMLVKRARLLGQSVGSRESFIAMNKAINAHRIEPVIDKIFEFHHYRAAWEHTGSGKAIGKTILRVG